MRPDQRRDSHARLASRARTTEDTILRVDALADEAAEWDLSQMTGIQVGNRIRSALMGKPLEIRSRRAGRSVFPGEKP